MIREGSSRDRLVTLYKISGFLFVGIGGIGLAQAKPVPPRQERAIVECVIGKAMTSLHQQLARKKRVTADAATSAAQDYAFKHCPKGEISEEGGETVYHTVKGRAQQLFGDE